MRIFSGIQPTGRKHLGNYIGAIRQYVDAMNRPGADTIFCIVDLHAITVKYEPAQLRQRLYDTTAILLAAGLDPDRCVLFRQADVREHTELTWLLCATTSYGELTRMHQFKDKSAKQGELFGVGILMYPVLMAADVLLYQADEVPVGDDQRQHVELTRVIAERFNSTFGETFKVPVHRIPTVGARIMDLQNPESKMSTTSGSEAGTVYVLDEPKAIQKKFKTAVTDSGSEVKRADDKPGISNLIEILAAVRGVSMDAVEAEFVGKQYGHLKVAVGNEVAEYLAPVREKYLALRSDEAHIESVLAAGATRARAIAEQTMRVTRERMGIGAPQR